jgi:hypothetical protein
MENIMEPENVTNARELLLAYFQENRMLKITGIENDEQCHIVYGEIQKRFAPIIGNLRFVRVGGCVEITHTYDNPPYGERSIDILNFLYGSGVYYKADQLYYFKPREGNTVVQKYPTGIQEYATITSGFYSHIMHCINKHNLTFVNNRGTEVGLNIPVYDKFGDSELVPFSSFVENESEEDGQQNSSDNNDDGYYFVELEEQENYFEIIHQDTVYGSEKECLVVTVKTNVVDEGFQKTFVKQLNSHMDVPVICVFIS